MHAASKQSCQLLCCANDCPMHLCQRWLSEGLPLRHMSKKYVSVKSMSASGMGRHATI